MNLKENNMKSENYRTVLNNAYKNRELTPEDFDNTLMHFAMLFNKEQANVGSGRQICSNKLENAVSETEYGVSDEKFTEIMSKLEPNLKDGDKVNITSEGDIDEVLQTSLSDIVTSMGIDMLNRSEEQKAQIKLIIKPAVDALIKGGYLNRVVKEDDKDSAEVDSLYSGADDRGVEYGIQSEDFDKMMEELKESGSPTIKVNEAINARIKKSDLVNYLKNKK
jgi:hypothetical protein